MFLTIVQVVFLIAFAVWAFVGDATAKAVALVISGVAAAVWAAVLLFSLF